MKRKELVKRVNERLDGRLYRWSEMEYEFDDAIIEINAKMQTKFPMIRDVLLYDDSEYKYFIIVIKDTKDIVLFYAEEDKNDYITNNLNNIQYTSVTEEIFPRRYINSIVIPYVVMRMLQREDEYGNLQSTMTQEYMNGINTMFMEYYDHVPPYFIREESDFKTYMNHGINNPFILKEEDKESGPLD